MTAFSFGYHLKHLKTDQPHPSKNVIIRVFFLCFTSQNETANSSLILALMISTRPITWSPSPRGGINLYRLLVAV